MCMFCRWLFVLLYFNLLVIVLSVLFNIRIMIILWYLQTLFTDLVFSVVISTPLNNDQIKVTLKSRPIIQIK